MGFITKGYLVCDRCDASVEIDAAFSIGISTELPTGWVRIDDDRFLCSACRPAYDLMKARHKVEENEFMSSNQCKKSGHDRNTYE